MTFHGRQLLLVAGKMKTLFNISFGSLLFAVFIEKTLAKVALSELIPICDAKSPDLNSCVLKSANLLIPHMSKGIKSFGFPPLDPLKVPRMDIGQDSGPVTLKLQLINTTHVGLSTLKFHSASIDLKRNQWILNGTIGYYSLTGKYKGNGRILVVPLLGVGKANFTFNDVGIDFLIDGIPKAEKSNVYFDLANLKVNLTFRKSFVSLTNLFGGNKVLGERTNRFLNENSGEVVNGLKNTLDDVYSALYKNLLKRITSSVPYNELLNNIFSPLLRLNVVQAETRGNESKEMATLFPIHPRLLFFGSSGECDADDELEDGGKRGGIEEDDDDEMCLTPGICLECEREKEKEKDNCESQPSKLGCMFQGAKNGVREGALTGLFLGGAFGLYRYFTQEDDGQSNDDDDDSSTINSVIFVSAINGGIAMAIISTIFCSIKGALYCN